MIGNDLKEDDQIWYIPGFSGNSLIAISSKIVKKQNNFYWIDEPISTPIKPENAFRSRELAERYLVMVVEEQEYPFVYANLDNFRKTQVFYLKNKGDLTVDKLVFRKKKRMIEWFNYKDIGLFFPAF